MSNILDATGLTVKTEAELLADKTAAYQAAYGSDINIDSDTPDGQIVNNEIQAILDQQDLALGVYNSMDPDKAIGVTLDQRVAFNGIQREAGTHTLTDITVVTDRALNLNGLDNVYAPQSFFVVSDNTGKQFVLIASTTIASSGSYVLQFQAVLPGKTLTTPNTITIAVTVVLGVVSVNNPTIYTTLGVNEETDAQLRLRRQQSVSINSQGFNNTLRAALKNINGIADAFIYENTTGSTDADGIPSHSIWVIVDNTGASNDDIANAIYTKRNPGPDMKGSVFVNILQNDGTLFKVSWDVVVSEDLYFKFDAHSINGIDTIDDAGIKAYLAANFHADVNQTININDLATLVRQFDPNCLVTNESVSTSGGGPFFNTLSPAAKNKRFTLSALHITITDV